MILAIVDHTPNRDRARGTKSRAPKRTRNHLGRINLRKRSLRNKLCIIMYCFVTGPVRSNSSIFATLLPRVSSMQNTKPSCSRCRFRGGKGNLYTRDLDGFIFSAIQWCQRKIGEETSSCTQSGRFLTAKALMQFIAIA